MRIRRGFSLVEVLITSVVLVGALVPMYFLFTGSSKSVFRSRISYMAMHVAREELEALRQISPDKLPLMKHNWEPVKGSILRHVTAPGDPAATLGAGASLDYPQTTPNEYNRIETKVSISGPGAADPDLGAPSNPHCYKVLLQVRWQEMGKDTDLGKVGHRFALSRFETVIADHRHK